MKLFSTGLDLRIRCGFLPLLEHLEFLVRSSVLAHLGYPRCSVSSRQLHELRTCSPPTKLGTCGRRSQTRRCVRVVFSLHCQKTFRNQVRELQEIVRSCSCDALPKLPSTKKSGPKNVNSEFIVECLMRVIENGKNK